MTSKTIMTAAIAAVIAVTLLTTGTVYANPELIAKLEAQITELKEKINSLRADIERVGNEHKANIADIREKHAVEVQELNDKLNIQKNRVDKHKNNTADLKATIVDLEAKHDKRIDKHKNTISNLEATIVELEVKLDKHKNNTSDQDVKHDKRVDKLKADKARLESRIVDLKATIEDLEAKFDKRVDKLKATIVELEASNDKLRDRVQDQKDKKIKWKQEAGKILLEMQESAPSNMTLAELIKQWQNTDVESYPAPLRGIITIKANQTTYASYSTPSEVTISEGGSISMHVNRDTDVYQDKNSVQIVLTNSTGHEQVKGIPYYGSNEAIDDMSVGVYTWQIKQYPHLAGIITILSTTTEPTPVNMTALQNKIKEMQKNIESYSAPLRGIITIKANQTTYASYPTPSEVTISEGGSISMHVNRDTDVYQDKNSVQIVLTNSTGHEQVKGIPYYGSNEAIDDMSVGVYTWQIKQYPHLAGIITIVPIPQ